MKGILYHWRQLSMAPSTSKKLESQQNLLCTSARYGLQCIRSSSRRCLVRHRFPKVRYFLFASFASVDRQSHQALLMPRSLQRQQFRPTLHMPKYYACCAFYTRSTWKGSSTPLLVSVPRPYPSLHSSTTSSLLSSLDSWRSQ